MTSREAYRAVSWESVILIAAMIPMSTALQLTGGVEFLAAGLVGSLGQIHPLVLMAGCLRSRPLFVRSPSEDPEASLQGFLLPPLELAIGVVLLLPDGDFLFEAFECSAAGVKGSRTMR